MAEIVQEVLERTDRWSAEAIRKAVNRESGEDTRGRPALRLQRLKWGRYRITE